MINVRELAADIANRFEGDYEIRIKYRNLYDNYEICAYGFGPDAADVDYIIDDENLQKLLGDIGLRRTTDFIVKMLANDIREKKIAYHEKALLELKKENSMMTPNMKKCPYCLQLKEGRLNREEILAGFKASKSVTDDY